MKRLWFVAVCLCLSGCITLPWEEHKPEFKYPSDIKTTCTQARKDAGARIASVDKKQPAIKHDSTVVKHPGQRKYGGMWCWYSSEWNCWVGGLCYLGNKVTIHVGCNPSDGQEIMYEVLVHENGHYWLWDTYKIANHPLKYKGVFINWREPTAVRIIQMLADGTIVTVDGYPVDKDHPAP